MAADFLADLLAAFWGVAWAEAVAGAAAGAAALLGALLATFFPPFLEILLEPVAFLVVLFATFFAPAGLALAIEIIRLCSALYLICTHELNLHSLSTLAFLSSATTSQVLQWLSAIKEQCQVWEVGHGTKDEANTYPL